MDYFLCVIGMVMIIEGLPYFTSPDKMKIVISRILKMNNSSIRQFGFFLMMTGLILVYFGRC